MLRRSVRAARVNLRASRPTLRPSTRVLPPWFARVLPARARVADARLTRWRLFTRVRVTGRFTIAWVSGAVSLSPPAQHLYSQEIRGSFNAWGLSARAIADRVKSAVKRYEAEEPMRRQEAEEARERFAARTKAEAALAARIEVEARAWTAAAREIAS